MLWSNKVNPFNLIANLKKAHDGISHWLDLALAAIRKDKRTHESINLNTYLNEYKEETWTQVLAARKTELQVVVNHKKDIILKGYKIDLDSLFNNLLINSFDAFDRKGFSGKRIVIKKNLDKAGARK